MGINKKEFTKNFLDRFGENITKLDPKKDFLKNFANYLSNKSDSYFDEFEKVIWLLLKNQNLNDIDLSYKDHELQGQLSGIRECHIKSDILLLYRYYGDVLILVDVENHNNL